MTDKPEVIQLEQKLGLQTAGCRQLAKSGVAQPENLLVKWRSHAGCGLNMSTMCFLWHLPSIDRLGFHLRLKTQDGMKGTRIAFLREVNDPSQTREVFVEMVKDARQG